MDETRPRVWPAAAAAGFSSQEEHLTQLKGDVARGYCARHGITPAIARKVRLFDSTHSWGDSISSRRLVNV